MTNGLRNSSLALRLVSAAVLACTAACGGPTEEGPEDAEALADVEPGAYVHKMPVRTEEERAAFRARSSAIINTAGSHLSYYGGKVVQKASVVQVIYGGSGTYTSAVLNNMGAFYSSVLGSAYVTWLSEYNTTSPAQTIGHGTFNRKVTITPAAARNKATITDANIQAEIAAQITAGTLPAPTNNTIYMVNFPKGKKISQGGSRSCQAGGFCAYHGTFKKSSQNVYYGVLPDMSAGSGCDTGCGSNSVAFNNQTSVASHELIETITDAEVGLATVVGPPLAWYDPANGEIGDICNGQQGTINGYTVQKEWSNKSGACKVQ